MRCPLSRRLSTERLLVLGPVSVRWPSPNSLTARACATSRRACARERQALSHGISRQGCAHHSGRCQRARRLAHLRRFRAGPDRASPGRSMPTIRSASTWQQVSTRWTPPPSICACRCSRGPSSASTKPPSSCTRCWICTAISPRSSALPTAKCTTSTSSTRSCRKPERSTSWTAATSILSASMGSRSAPRFFVVRTKSNVLLQRRYSHPVDKTTGVRSDHTVILTASIPPKAIPKRCDACSYLDAGNQEAVHVSHQQLRPASTYHRPDLQVPLAGRTVLQVDQAAPADQGLLSAPARTP